MGGFVEEENQGGSFVPVPHTQRKDQVSTWRKGGYLASPGQIMLVPDSTLQSIRNTDAYCPRHLLHGILLWQPNLTQADDKHCLFPFLHIRTVLHTS